MDNEISHEQVKEYYGEVLSSTKDLKTSACCSFETQPAYLREILSLIHTEVTDRFYGCGSPIPPGVEGQTVLDLGCGTGRDSFIFSKLVGASGQVIGVDMTKEQIDIALKHREYHAKKFGFQKPNTNFKTGYIENLVECGIKDSSIDIVVSNCVINLSPNKEAIFKEIFRVLKPGGEIYFSDIFSSQRIPENLNNDPILKGECLSGAMYTQDFRRLLLSVGCADYRIMSERSISLDVPEIENKIGMIDFLSITVRAFKLNLEDRCEDYGQTATYLGNIPDRPLFFELDNHHKFITGKPMLVCGNTADMVSSTRFGRYFKVTGNKSRHFGLFDCNEPKPSKFNIVGSCC